MEYDQNNAGSYDALIHKKQTSNKNTTSTKTVPKLDIKVLNRVSGKLLSFDEIKKNLEIEINSGNTVDKRIIMYLFFFYTSWRNLFKRTESFTSFIEGLSISKTKGLRIRRVIEIISEYHDLDLENKEYLLCNSESNNIELLEILGKLFDPIDKIGVSKIDEIFPCKSIDKRNELIAEMMIKPDTYTRLSLRAKVAEVNKGLIINTPPDQPRNNIQLSFTKNTLKVNDKEYVSFGEDIPQEDKKQIKDYSKQYYNAKNEGGFIITTCVNNEDEKKYLEKEIRKSLNTYREKYYN